MQVDINNFFNNVLKASPEQVEEMINLLGQDEVLTLVNKSRQILLDNPEAEQPPEVTRASLLLVRKFRSFRENSKKTSTAKKAAAAQPALSMADLLNKVSK